ncbi:MAG TPA: hypothetical protein VN193_06210 [Candidatus Angelobacter sp.]|jgi:hypothetical protein|nr:hypothetical protein [Candidatus Angelobacter sp.]
MPLFRRGPRQPAPTLQVTVGMSGHRVLAGVADPGIAQLGELRDYVGAVTGHAGPNQQGRDPVAVLNAKMDYAELVDDAAVVVVLAFEELVAQGVVAADEVPAAPELPPVPQHADTYDFIQASHARAQRRMEFLEACDEVLVRHGVAIVAPLPPEDR